MVQRAGHPRENVTYVPLPDYVSFTDWAEDGYVALKDASDGSGYLMEPWEFPRAGDALIAESVQEYVELKAAQAPLIFQGGNCLVGDEFWLIGKDYVADSVALVHGERPPVDVPSELTPEAFVRQLFKDYVDARRRLLIIGTNREIPLQACYGTRDSTGYYLDLAAGGAGTFQPIFHIDMFISLIGRNQANQFEMLVGSPRLGAEILKTPAPYALDDVYDSIAKFLTQEGMKVHRNPLVHQSTPGRTFSFWELRDLAAEDGRESLRPAVQQLQAAGAVESTTVRVRDWHHITWNNCLVENSSTTGKRVYLPTFGHGTNERLRVIDERMKAIWEGLGFTVHLLGDFNEFARRQGVVHCIKKYLDRSI